MLHDKETLQRNKNYLEDQIRKIKLTITEAKRRAACYGEYLPPEEMSALEEERIILGKRHQNVLNALAEANREAKKNIKKDYFRVAARELLSKESYKALIQYAADLEEDDSEEQAYLERAEAMA